MTQLYGIDQAVPLLNACEENFAFEMITANKVVLSERMVETLYRKYPDLVIKYLKLSKGSADDVRNLYDISISDYTDFLPEVANNRFADFMEIYEMHDGCLDIKLGKKAANVFVKTRGDLLVTKPDRYLKLVSLKTATQKLSTENFAEMFKNLFPAKKEDFRYSRLNTYLQYYKPERERVPLLLNTFRLVYGTDLLSCRELVNSDLIKVLPADERVKQARLKLADDKDWHYDDPEESWRCYLPTSESIPAITKEIGKSSDAENRGQLLKQLIYTSKVNDDKNAFLKVLNYIYDRHRNEQKYIFYNCVYKICESFDLASLSSAHWEVLYKYIKLAETQDNLVNQTDSMTPVLEAALHFCVLNDLPFDNYFRILVDMKIHTYYCRWNILTKYLELERKFMDLLMEVIPKQYPFDTNIWKDKEFSIIKSLASSLWEFNKHNKNSHNKLKNLFVRDYPWLLEKIKICIVKKRHDDNYTKWNLLKLMRENERDLYDEFISDLDEFWAFDVQIISDILKRQPERVVKNWKECLQTVRDKRSFSHEHSSFIAKSQWYQDLPIRFFDESLRTFNDPKECDASVFILALLTDGKTYATIIEPYIPTAAEIDTNHPEAKNTYNILLAITSNLRRVNPLVPLEVIAKFCVGDYLQMALRSLTSICRRVPVTKVIPFAKMLTNRPVSVMKHGIRLIYLVATLEEIYTVLADIWNTEKHTSIRSVVFTKTYDLFRKQPDARTWRMIRTCVANLNTNDDDEIFRSLPNLSTVPNEYLCEYIKLVSSAMKSLQEKSEDPSRYIETSRNLISNIDGPIAQILPEEFTQELIKKYLFVFEYSPEVMEIGMKLTLDSYLLASRKYNESRFNFFKDFFKDSVKKYWDKLHPKCVNFYPMNFMTHKFFDRACSKNHSRGNFDLRIFESLIEIFQSVLEPIQDAGSYLYLVYVIEYHKSNTAVDFGTRLVEKIPEFIEKFTPECVVPMSDTLLSFITYLLIVDKDEEFLLSVIEVFANHETIHCALIAARMLFDNKSKELDKRHKAVVRTLRNFRHPGISWFLNERLTTNNFCPVSDEE